MNLLVSLSVTFSLIGIAPYCCSASPDQSINHSLYLHSTLCAQPSLDSLQRYVGTYELAPGQQLTVSLVTDILYIVPPNETAKAALKPVGNSEFVVVGEEAYLLFKQDPIGQITAVEIRFGNGASAVGKKLYSK